MAYTPTTDFLGLLRQTSGGAVLTRMPGLDFVLDALFRAGMFQLSVGQVAPIVNQATTAWFQPALPSWTAEGILFLWDVATGQYEVATPALWIALLSGSGGGYLFQSAAAASNAIQAGVSLLAIQRTVPSTTNLLLPNIVGQWSTGRKLQIADFSTGVVSHTVTLTPQGTSTIMQRPSWALLSTADSAAGIMLQPSPELNSWVIAP